MDAVDGQIQEFVTERNRSVSVSGTHRADSRCEVGTVGRGEGCDLGLLLGGTQSVGGSLLLAFALGCQLSFRGLGEPEEAKHYRSHEHKAGECVLIHYKCECCVLI